MSLFLTGQVGERRESWPLDAPVLRIGRSSRNSIPLSDPTVSKEHAEILRQGERWFIRDLGSRNGTRVNGIEATDPLPLAAGDRVEVGHVQLEISDGDSAPVVRYSDATVISSSVRLRVGDVLERRAKASSSGAQVLHLLAEAGQMLVLPRPLRETCEQILELVERAVPASRHILLLRPGEAEEPVQMAARSGGGRAGEPLAMSRSILRTVLDECTAVLTRDAALDPRFAGQQSIVMQAVRSAMAVPLFDNERVLGLIYVDSQDARTVFGEEQLEVLSLLANMAAVKITNARLLEAEQMRARLAQEAATATQIQRGLLPHVPPHHAGWAFEAHIDTCYEVGGDLYDWYVREDGRIVIAVGDVSGKGMGASLLMSSFLSTARALYDAIPEVAALAKRVGTHMARNSESGRFVTGFVGVLDPETGTLDYVNAGHPPPCAVLGSTLRTLEATGIPFGILPEFPYTAGTMVLAPGEALALFSDGLPEAQHEAEFFEDERLHRALIEGAALSSLDAMRRAVLGRIDEFVAGSPRTDDLTLFLVRRGDGAGAPTAA